MKKEYRKIPVLATSTKRFPRYIRKAQFTQYLCFGGFDREGNCRADIGLAIMQNGDLIPIWWGGQNGNLSFAEAKDIRQKDHKSEFIYIGRVYDAAFEDSRDNFAKVIQF